MWPKTSQRGGREPRETGDRRAWEGPEMATENQEATGSEGPALQAEESQAHIFRDLVLLP